jgi:hypothetical protein
MVTLELESEQANLDEVRRLLGLGGHELDTNFGVVNISPKDHLYTILVDPEAAERIRGAPPVRGVFANPRIEPT